MNFVSFGEILLRLTPTFNAVKIGSTDTLEMNFAGSESNVASSLGFLGNRVKFISKVPDNSLGDAACASLRKYGVDTSQIAKGGNRIGIYFIETGKSIRPSKVIYDRAGSAISEIKQGAFNWNEILLNQDWLFVSGITPVLSASCASETLKAVTTAKNMGVKVAFDPNFRRSLWSSTAAARKIFLPILEQTDLLFGNYGMMMDVFDYTPKGDSSLEKSMHSIEKASEIFTIPRIAFTVRDHSSASKNKISAILRADNSILQSNNTYDVEIMDRFGTGDAFAAAFLHAYGKEWKNQQALDFATAAFGLKHTIKGDQHTSTEEEITSIMHGNTQGHVIR
ncbi:sugar kinase [Aurantibacter crassamenti]|uniref:sugar kinase n=1 Tax=Aurantibacter crassamenti TaxID=1837375 RepID=UPI00193A9E45|nr:sugar kinase [Aurantibacter crassamenti]MBM1105673.1 sugar kinase [Aurantibacter crassamenti]